MTSARPVEVRIGDVVRTGPGIVISQAIDAGDLYDAVRGCIPQNWELTGGNRQVEFTVSIAAPTPSDLYEHVGHIHPEMGLRTRTALAKAARTRGLDTPQDDAIEAARERLSRLGSKGDESANREQLRHNAAMAQRETERLRERVAMLRGRLQERQDAGRQTESIAADLESAVAKLSAAETEAHAAREELEQARSRARDHRDTELDRFAVAEELANLERKSRSSLVDQLEPAYRKALADIMEVLEPEPDDPDASVQALAIVRISALEAPVVLATDHFDHVNAAVDWLDTPVIQV